MNHVDSVAGQNGKENYLLHVIDSQRNEKWLVDGGAFVSLLPPTAQQRRNGPNGIQLMAANGTNIACYGTTMRSITIGNTNFEYEFIIADVRTRILGSDFLANFYLAPNHRDAKLINLKDFSTLPASHAHGIRHSPINLVSERDDPFYKLLDQYPEIQTPSFTIKDPEHGVRHHIPTGDHPPCQSRARRLDPEKLAVAKAELEKLVDLGVAYRGKSEWSSPLLVTTKPCGGWRVCGDYRRLNAMTTDDQYPVRTLQDFTSELSGKSFFSKIDLMKGYHQIPVADPDIRKTAVITPFGLFIFPRTPFGLKNAGQDFQRLMDEILGDIPRVFVYIDDILVASETQQQHLEDLENVFKTLSANGMVIQRTKCVLGKPSLEFLGYCVDEKGITPLPEKVDAIRAATPPTTVKELQRWLGMVGYYRKFLPRAAVHLFHLFEALKGKPKALEWTQECQQSFDATKEALARASMLFHPRKGAQLAVTTDASNVAVGGVLEQRGPKGWEPIAFYSSKLEPHQRVWPPYDRELLGCFKSIRHFKHMLEGRPFTLYTDHASLVPSMTKKTDPQTIRQTYQLACISEYTTDIRYLKGKANVVADALSRPNEEIPDLNSVEEVSRGPSSPEDADADAPVNHLVDSSSKENANPTPSTTNSSTTPSAREEASRADLQCVVNAIGDLGIDWQAVATEQPLDPDLRRLRRDANSGLNLKSIDIGQRNIVVDISNGTARPFIPFSFRKRLFDVLHGLGHPGVERTRQSICSKVIWPSMREDVSKWARQCLQCQQAKIIRHTVPPIGDFKVPDKRFEHLHLDIVTLPPSNGFRHLLTMVDRFTRWPVAIPIADITAQSVVDAFTSGWIQNFGVPSTITTDRGSQFTSEIFQQLTKIWGIKAITTAPYHPEANGMVERLHRRLKESLVALGSEEPHKWFWRLPCAMLAIRTTVKPDIGASPADLVFGEGLAVPGELLPREPPSDDQLLRQRASALADLRLEVARLQPTETSAHRRPMVHLPADLQRCTHVFVRRGGVQSNLASPYVGPFRVVSRDHMNFKVAIPGRQNETVAICRVKPAYADFDDAEDAAPPSPPPPGRRPRPPRRRRQRGDADAAPEQPPAPRQRSPTPPTPPRPQRTPSPPRPPPASPEWFSPGRVMQRHPNSPPDAAPAPPPAPAAPQQTPPRRRLFSNPSANGFASRMALPQPSAASNAPPAPRRVEDRPEASQRPPDASKRRFFSTASGSNFSRRRPDVSALVSAIHAHLRPSTPSDDPSHSSM